MEIINTTEYFINFTSIQSIPVSKMDHKPKKLGKREDPQLKDELKLASGGSLCSNLIEKIKSKVVEGKLRSPKAYPQSKGKEPNAKETTSGTGVDLSKYLKKTPDIKRNDEMTLKSLNKSLMTRLSNLRAGGRPIENQSLTQRSTSRRINESRDRSSLKERINKLSTLERNLKQIESTRTGRTKAANSEAAEGKITMGNIYKIQSGSDLKMDKQKLFSTDAQTRLSSGAAQGKDLTATQKMIQEVEQLKRRIENIPTRSAMNKIIDSPRKKEQFVRPQIKTNSVQINMISPSTDLHNIQKKKVDHWQYKREEQTSLKMVKARRKEASEHSENRNSRKIASSRSEADRK